MLKNVLFLVHLPTFIVGIFIGTILYGLKAGIITALEYWQED